LLPTIVSRCHRVFFAGGGGEETGSEEHLVVVTDTGSWRNPLRRMGAVLNLLESLRQEHVAPGPRVLIISGDPGSGKTTLVRNLLQHTALQDSVLAGFTCTGVWESGERDRYYLETLGGTEKALLCDRDQPESAFQSGPFHFRDAGISLGKTTLQQSAALHPDLVVIDEIGPLELEGLGWAPEIDTLSAVSQNMLWTVRTVLLEQVVSKWPVAYRIISVNDYNTKTVAAALQWLLGS
jgi:nucleoside-triphosphatase THEP1